MHNTWIADEQVAVRGQPFEVIENTRVSSGNSGMHSVVGIALQISSRQLKVNIAKSNLITTS